MDLFEQLRREHEFGIGTIAGVAAKFGVHRRVVRQALASALPPPHRYPPRAKPKLGVVAAFIDTVLEEDCRAPRKQRHTARRLYRRILTEFPDATARSPSRRCAITCGSANGKWDCCGGKPSCRKVTVGLRKRRSTGMKRGSISVMSAPRCRCLQCARWPAGRR